MRNNGNIPTATNGQEDYENCTIMGRKVVQYDYRHTDGELFSVVRPTLEKCRAARDKWLAERQAA